MTVGTPRTAAGTGDTGDTGAIILVVGDVINDVVVRPLAHITTDSDTRSRISHSPGGSGANQAAWLGALGARVRFAGRAGARDLAVHADQLRACGVDARLASDSDADTGSIVIVVDEGRRTMFTDRGANLDLSPDDLPDELLDGVERLHVSGYSFFAPRVRDAVCDLLRRAQGRGVTVSVDPASAAFLREVGAEAFLEWTAPARVVFPNLDEGRMLTGAEAPEAIVTALLPHYPLVALKLGRDGAIVATRDGARIAAPSRASEVVDPTGAGDAFCAGFLRAWTRGCALEDAAGAALAAAALAVRTMGARPTTVVSVDGSRAEGQ